MLNLQKHLYSSMKMIKNSQLNYIKMGFNFSSKNTTTGKLNIKYESENEKPKLKIVNRVVVQDGENNKNDNKSYLPYTDVPFFVLKASSLKKRPAKTTPSIKSKELDYSSYKLNDTCKLIRGKYIRNALEILQTSQTKGSKIVTEELNAYLKRMDIKRGKRVAFYQKKGKMVELEEMKKLENLADSENKSDTSSNLENENSETNLYTNNEEEEAKNSETELRTFHPYEDYKIVEAYVGRKVGHSIPSPRAKGKTDLIERSVSRLFIYIEKVNAEDFYEKVAIGKTDFTFAHNMRKSLFMNGASLSTLRNFSFITTSKGRHYRKQQFERLITYLRMKFFKEKGIKLNTEVVRDSLKAHLGKELAKINPINLTNLLTVTNNVDFITKLYNKISVSRIRSLRKDKVEQYEDKSLRARENVFNNNFKKIE